MIKALMAIGVLGGAAWAAKKYLGGNGTVRNLGSTARSTAAGYPGPSVNTTGSSASYASPSPTGTRVRSPSGPGSL